MSLNGAQDLQGPSQLQPVALRALYTAIIFGGHFSGVSFINFINF